MATPRPRTVAAVLGLLALAAFAGSLGHPAVIEQWYLWRLDSEDEAVRRAAAEALGKRRSVRAIPRLVGLLRSGRGLNEYSIEGYMITKERLTSATNVERSGAVADWPWEEKAKQRFRDGQKEVLRDFRTNILAQLPNSFALDVLVEIGRPALDYVEGLDDGGDGRIAFIESELRDSMGGQVQDEP